MTESRGTRIRQALLALGVAMSIAGVGATGAFAQESLGSTVSVGGGISGVEGGDVAVVAPGVTLSGGDVVNATGIGVAAGGGSSIGATSGGDDSAAVVE